MSAPTCPTNARWPGDVVGCGSTNVKREETPGAVLRIASNARQAAPVLDGTAGLYDCLDCGIWFAWPEGASTPRAKSTGETGA